MKTATLVPRDSVGSWSSESSMTTRSSGRSSGRRSTSGRPMLPPRIARWVGSTASSARVSAEVVVLHFVPVTRWSAPGRDAGRDRVRTRSRGAPVAGLSGRPQRDQRGPEARLRCRIDGRDRRRRRDECGAAPRVGRVDGGSGQQSDGPTLEAPDRFVELARRPAVVDRDDSPGIDEEPGEGDPAPGEAQDGHGRPARAPARWRRDRDRRDRAPLGSRAASGSSSSCQRVDRGHEQGHAEQAGEDRHDPEPHSRFTVSAGVSIGRPARKPT